MKQEMQHWLSRNRPPRVQITYDVETLGATVKEEIPFIAGIIGDFAGGTTLDPLAKRPFVEIDRDSFPKVMAGLAPSLQLGPVQPYVAVRTPEGTSLQPGTNKSQQFSPHLDFATIDDFAPVSIIQQVPALAALLQKRRNLSDLMARLGTDPTLEGSLTASVKGAAMTQAQNALPDISKNMGSATDTTPKLFAAAVAAVLVVEAADPNKTSVTNAGKGVDALVGTAGSYPRLYGIAKPSAATSADVAAAGAEAWKAAVAMREGMKLLASITAGYAGSSEENHTTAVRKVAAAQVGVDAFVAAAGQAALSGASALALDPSSPTPPTS